MGLAQETAFLAAAVVAGLLFWRGTRDIFSLVRVTAFAVLATSLVGATALRAVRRPFDLPPRDLGAAAAVFAALLVGTSAAAAAPMTAIVGPYGRFIGAALYLSLLVLLLVGSTGLQPHSVRRLTFTFATVLGVVVLYGIVQATGADPFDWPGAITSTHFATFGQVNFAAGWVAITTPLALWVALEDRHPAAARLFAGGVVLAATYYVFDTRSVQGPVALASGLAFIVLVRAASGERFPVRVSGRAIVGVALVVAALAVVLFMWKFDSVADELDFALEERRLLWRTAGEMIRDDPWSGRGFGGYARAFTEFRPEAHAEMSGNTIADDPHNVPLNIAVSGGLPLLVAYLALLGAVAVRLASAVRTARGADLLLVSCLGAAWVAYLVQSLVSIDAPALSAMNWILGAAIIAMGRHIVPRVEPQRDGSSSGRRVSALVAAVVAGVAVLALPFIVRPLLADAKVSAASDAAERGDVRRAVSLLQDARDLASWEASYAAALATVQLRAGNPDAALVAGEDAVRLAPGAIQYSLTLAKLADATGKTSMARRWYLATAERDPFNAPALIAAAKFLQRHNDHQEALALLGRVRSLKPEDSDVWMALFDSYTALGRDGAARDAYDTAQRLAADLRN